MNYLQIDSPFVVDELVAVLAFVAAVFLAPRSVWRSTSRTLSRLVWRLTPEGNRELGAALVISVLVLLCDFAFAALVRLPEANYHDEFSYLLAADTFARGRLANPPAGFSQHFESFHLLATPSYQSKYPPGQGLFLAAGLALTGFAGLGVWLSHSLAAGAVCWCLAQFVTVRWAFFAALTFGLHDRVLIWWGQTYWGGAVAALAGALLFGGFGRWLRTGSTKTGVLMGVGAGLLALSRPVEGLICCGFVLCGLGAKVSRSAAADRLGLFRGAVLGGVVGVVPFLIFLAAYNHAVTGNSLQFPYQLWVDQYQIGLGGIAAANREMTPFGELQFRFFAAQEYRHEGGFSLWKAVFRLRPFYLPSLAILALLGFRWPRSIPGCVLVAAVVGVTLFVLLNPAGGFPHYLAPVAAPITLGVVVGFRRAAVFVPRASPSMALVAFAVLMTLAGCRLVFAWPHVGSLSGGSVESARAELSINFENRQLDALVLVLYGGGHLPAAEFVYNGGELRASTTAGGPRVLWARALGETPDRLLVAGYPERQAYVYYLDAGGGTLIDFEEFASKNPGYSWAPDQ